MTESPQLESASKDTSKEAKFDWNKQWYPVAIIKDLEEDQPLAVTVIGRPLAVWWDKSSNKWQVYADKCPHRLAPLSEGSITQDGQLRCSYHGWTFKGDSGECTFIPQAPSDSKPVSGLSPTLPPRLGVCAPSDSTQVLTSLIKLSDIAMCELLQSILAETAH